MNFFTAGNGKLIYEYNGETLQSESWDRPILMKRRIQRGVSSRIQNGDD